MRPLLTAAVIVATASLAQVGRAATPVDGLWRASSGGGLIELHECGDTLCGRVVDSNGLKANPDLRDDGNPKPDLRDRQIRGLDILYGFKGGPVLWTDGRIYDPARGRTYHGTLKVLAPDRLRLSGCVVYPLCGNQVWRKVAQPPPPAG